jgi:predicted metal-dependent HD superfamily phosphohydrolase
MGAPPDSRLAEDIIQAHAPALGRDRLAYTNHVLRVLRFFQELGGGCPDQVVIAAAFHDLGIWTDGTFDYLMPSVRLAHQYLESTGHGSHAPEVEAIILNHHKLTRYRGPFGRSVELFRRADLVDVSLGLIRFGIQRAVVRDIRASLPNSGFHRRLTTLVVRQLLHHPLRPLPMVRW